MEISKNIKVTNNSGQTAAFLSPKADKLKSCYPDCRLNGESTLEFYLPAKSAKLQYLTHGCRIYAGDRVYSLIKDNAIEYTRDGRKLWAKVMAYELQYELDYEFPEPYINNDPTITNPADLSVTIVGGGSDLSGDLYTVGSAGHALYAVLNGSGWTVGTVDVTGTYDLEMEKTSRLQLIKQIQNIWGGYLVWDSVNKTVSLRSGSTWAPYNGFQIRYAKNLKSITKTQSNKLYTKLYAFGHDDLDIASVNDGVKYITNHTYTSLTYVGIYKNQDIYDASELLAKATAELALNCKPRYAYSCKAFDLRTLPEFSHEEFTLGDMADAIDPAVAPDSPRIRILRHKYNLFQPWDCEFELGDPEERFIEDLKASFTTSDYVSSISNSSGKISAETLEDLTITAGKIKKLTITADEIAKATITADEIANLTITANEIANLTITGGKIANATIGNAKIIDLSADKITAGTITATISIQGPSIYGGKFYGPNVNNAYIAVGVVGDETSNLGNFSIYRGINGGDYPVFSVSDGISSMELQAGLGAAVPTTFLSTTGGQTYCYNSWTSFGGDWDMNVGKIGFFGTTPITQRSAQRLASTATLSDVIAKINGILDKLGNTDYTGYGLFNVYD